MYTCMYVIQYVHQVQGSTALNIKLRCERQQLQQRSICRLNIHTVMCRFADNELVA